MTSLFDVMQMQVPVQATDETHFTENEVFALFDFQSEVYRLGKNYNFRVQKGIMPLRGTLMKLLKDAYRRRKDGKVIVKWADKAHKSMAFRDANTYQKAIEELLATSDRQTKLRHSPSVLEYLNSTKTNLESLALKIRPITP